MRNGRAARSWVATLAVVVALGAPATGNAVFGDVDTTFGDLGSAPLAGTPNPGISTGLMSIVPNTGGFALVGSTGDGRRDVLVDVRHGATGSLLSDPVRQTAIGVGNAQAGPAVAAPDGGTFVSFSRHTGFGPTVAVARFRPDRTLDPAFGSGGVVTLPGRGGRVRFIADIALGPAGTVVLALTSEDLDGVNRGVLVRLLPNGALDPSFGAGGLVATDLGPSNDEPALEGIVVDGASGVVTVAASTYVSPNGVATVFRFLSSGAPDGSFSGDGRVDIDGLPSIFPRDIAVDASGRPVLVATRYPGGNRQATVLRVTTAGVLDGTFGVGGMRNVSPPLALSGADGDHLAIAGGTGAITVVGRGAGFAAAPLNRVFMARVTAATGALDGTFGPGGMGIADYPAAPTEMALTMAPIGANVVVAGIATAGGGHGWMGVNAAGTVTFSGTQVPLGASTGRDLDILLSRPDGGAIGLTGLFSGTTLDMASLTPAGMPDPVVGGSGVSTLTVPAASHIIDAQRLPSGAVVVVGYESAGTGAYVARFRAEGGADPGFGGGDGFVPATVPAGSLRFTSVVANPDGSIVAAGFGTTPPRAEVRKYLADGTPDLAFGGGDGVATISTPVFTEVHSVGRTSGGGIVVVGESATGAIVARLTPDGAPDSTFGAAGVVQIDVAGITGENTNHGVVDSKDRVLLSFSDGQEGVPLVDSLKAWVIRLTSAGVADPSFGTAGVITLSPTRPGLSLRLARGSILADDSYVSSAYHTPGASYSTLLRIDSAGTVTTRSTLLTGTYASPMPDGRVILSGLNNGLNAVRVLGSPPATPTLTASATSETAIGLEATADAAGFTGVSLVTESGPTAAFGLSAPPVPLAAIQGPQKVSRTLSGLTPGQAYHLRAVVANASGTAASGPTVVTTPRIAPSARITLPRRKRALSASWRTLRGTAVDPAPSSGVARVEVGLYRRAGKRCVALTPRGFRRMTCKLALQAFVPTNGTAKWTRRVPALVTGKYTLRVRATDGAGIPQAGFVTGRSRVIVKIAAKKKPKKKVVKKKP